MLLCSTVYCNIHCCSSSELVILHDSKEVQEISAKDGEVLQVDCVMMPSFPPESHVKWYHPTVAKANSSTSWKTDRSAYSLKINLKPTDSGDYKCEVDISDEVFEKRIEIKGKSILPYHIECIHNIPHFPLQCNKPRLQWLLCIQ